MVMVNWQVTATTIHCGAVDDEVTLMVYKDGSARCVGYKRYGEPSREIRKLMEREGKRVGRKLECGGPECCRLVQYRDKLFAEEAGSKSSDLVDREMGGIHDEVSS